MKYKTKDGKADTDGIRVLNLTADELRQIAEVIALLKAKETNEDE